jgi:hypothetical protein
MTAVAEASGNRREQQAVAVGVREGVKVEHHPVGAESTSVAQEECPHLKVSKAGHYSMASEAKQVAGPEAWPRGWAGDSAVRLGPTPMRPSR